MISEVKGKEDTQPFLKQTTENSKKEKKWEKHK